MVTSILTFFVIVLVYFLTLIQSLFVNLPIARRLPISLHPNMVVLGSIGSFAATVALFWLLYRFSPARSPSNIALLVGAVAASGLFEVSKIAFGLYVRSFQGTSALYGTLSGLVFFFLWLYYASVVFVIGAAVGWVFDNRHD